MNFDIGAMVSVRGREWVVLPDSTDDFLLLKPLGGSDAEVAGIFVGDGGERVRSATFALPDPTRYSDAASARLLLNAARLAIRSGAGPFRSLGRLGVEPRPYQLVPLLMALRMTTVRLMIADDVGIGKTVEAALIARELLDRGEISRVAVLCPPHLVEQWVTELRVKFGLEAAAVLPSTVRRLERDCNAGQSLFQRHRHVVVSLDLVKQDRWRAEFLRQAPEFVIVDEAHASAEGDSVSSKRHQRYRLLEELAGQADRHLVLVTATPHSGKEDAFRSLLKLLHRDFATLDLSGTGSDRARATLARHLVQRRRADIDAYLSEDTPFPSRKDAEVTYRLHPEYARLFQDVLAYARESIEVPGESHNRQRIRWWAALGLLRALSSSPQAAAATLRARAVMADETDGNVIEGLGREMVLDPAEDDRETLDLTPGAQTEGDTDAATRRLLELAERAEALTGAQDRKLEELTAQLKGLLKLGLAPIVFCRFIATAEHVARHLQGVLKGAEVQAVTGRLTPHEREAAVTALAAHPVRVLIATDCLSEGINLQQDFNAVVHYDLPWNPTRLDQREGRVDRYGQTQGEVRVLTLYGEDNQIDQLVLEVLVRKHRAIRATLGASVPAPDEAENLLDVLLARVIQGESPRSIQDPLFAPPELTSFEAQWQAAADREKRSRSRFAQNAIRTDEVARELRAVRAALGSNDDAQGFFLDALRAGRVTVTPHPAGRFTVDPAQPDARPELRDVLRQAPAFRFDAQLGRSVVSLARNHPLVEQLASTVLGQALDDGDGSDVHDPLARRVGAIRTRQVSTQTTLLLLRHRFHLSGRRGNRVWQTLAEELDTVAFRGSLSSPEWLSAGETAGLLDLQPDDNLPGAIKEQRLRGVLAALAGMGEALNARARERADTLLEAHERVRGDARTLGATYTLEPPGPPDVLGVYVFVPMPVAGQPGFIQPGAGQ